MASVHNCDSTKIFIYTLISSLRGGRCFWQLENDKRKWILQTTTASVPKTQLLGHTNVCMLQLRDTADCICSLSLTVWLQGSSSTAQMGTLFSVQAALTHSGNSKLWGGFMLHRKLLARIWQQDYAGRCMLALALSANVMRIWMNLVVNYNKIILLLRIFEYE